ncbi:glycosyltransferase [Microbacterium sp. zg-Y818]|uniref:glycosyltransferase n=1 Tax=unclassified Microbacterium TaxID=2609290 RepID=UPI00214B4063|nr:MULTISPECIES: glycosyltransferase [unclassified Microbacterium]MCR2801710.1 glycosyltransferase [Microbacterium sp. zg.Y818]WIM23023.1 glycosyltransferase [Microbacterium sp. zg-Y818]
MMIDLMLPYWGDPDLLFRTVDSVRAQTDPRWRLTVLDDGYPDPRVADFFAGVRDDRIRYVRREENAGIVANFRASVRQSQAEYLTVLGSDDLLEPGYVAHVHEVIARHPGADIIQPGVVVIDAEGTPYRPLADRIKHAIAPRTDHGDVELQGERLATSLVRGNWLYWPSLVFRREAIARHDFRDDLPIILDLAILLDLVFDGATLVATGAPVFRYRRHRASASQTSLLSGRRFDDERRFYAEVAARAAGAGWSTTARAARARLLSRLHALTELPRVLREGSPAGRSAALRHILR